jgi:hypothetical protein
MHLRISFEKIDVKVSSEICNAEMKGNKLEKGDM